MTQRTIEELYRMVNKAIHRTDTAVGPEAAEAAHREVSLLEEQLAQLLPGSDEQGVCARRGVLYAALAARDYARAVQMADKYLAEPDITSKLRTRLQELRAEAQRKLDAGRRSGE